LRVNGIDFDLSRPGWLSGALVHHAGDYRLGAGCRAGGAIRPAAGSGRGSRIVVAAPLSALVEILG
jgi:hypothetical protein